MIFIILNAQNHLCFCFIFILQHHNTSSFSAYRHEHAIETMLVWGVLKRVETLLLSSYNSKNTMGIQRNSTIGRTSIILVLFNTSIKVPKLFYESGKIIRRHKDDSYMTCSDRKLNLLSTCLFSSRKLTHEVSNYTWRGLLHWYNRKGSIQAICNKQEKSDVFQLNSHMLIWNMVSKWMRSVRQTQYNLFIFKNKIMR